MLEQDAVDHEEEEIRSAAGALTDNQRREYYTVVEKQLKDPDTYAVLNWLFIAGMHHFYLGRWWRGAFNLVIFLAGAVVFLLGHVLVSVGLLGFVFLIELPALFRSQVIVQDYNNKVMRQILEQVQKFVS